MREFDAVAWGFNKEGNSTYIKKLGEGDVELNLDNSFTKERLDRVWLILDGQICSRMLK